jgi:hypothetical protein
MSQITIRDIPEKLEAYIRKRASTEGVSLSKAANDMLAEASGIKDMEKRYRDLSAFAGAWSPEEAARFEKAQVVFERIDEDEWK